MIHAIHDMIHDTATSCHDSHDMITQSFHNSITTKTLLDDFPVYLSCQVGVGCGLPDVFEAEMNFSGAMDLVGTPWHPLTILDTTVDCVTNSIVAVVAAASIDIHRMVDVFFY